MEKDLTTEIEKVLKPFFTPARFKTHQFLWHEGDPGSMTATGCTYGKSNIEKLYFNKMAFTLIDNKTGRAVRVSLKPDFFEMALASPFVQLRKAGPLINRILGLEESQFLDTGEIHTVDIKKAKGVFDAKRCEACGELTFINKLRVKNDGALVCIPCSNYGE